MLYIALFLRYRIVFLEFRSQFFDFLNFLIKFSDLMNLYDMNSGTLRLYFNYCIYNDNTTKLQHIES